MVVADKYCFVYAIEVVYTINVGIREVWFAVKREINKSMSLRQKC